jgi:hypothetical protein
MPASESLRSSMRLAVVCDCTTVILHHAMRTGTSPCSGAQIHMYAAAKADTPGAPRADHAHKLKTSKISPRKGVAQVHGQPALARVWRGLILCCPCLECGFCSVLDVGGAYGSGLECHSFLSLHCSVTRGRHPPLGRRSRTKVEHPLGFGNIERCAAADDRACRVDGP